jgi:uncharacterized repeat protein (TIGR01451 family)
MSGASRWLLGITLSVSSLSSWAVGIPSGTAVINTVTADYEIASVPQPQQSTSIQFRVDNRIDFSIAVTNDTVSPAQINQALTYVIVNEGNTTQGYALSVANSTAADNFDMNNVRIYIENGATPGFQLAQDTLYVATSNAGDLNPNILGADTMTVYVVSDVPPTGGGTAPVDTNTARYDLLVTTLNAGSSTVTVGNNTGAWLPNTVQNVFAEGIAGPSTADNNDDGKLSATGEYGVNVPALVKSAVVTDALGNPSPPVTAATITYTLLVTVPASGTVDNVIITDAIPANTTYVTNSLTLNASALSDSADADEGDFNITNANNITVDLGTLTNASGNQTITFSVTIN